MYRSLQFTAVTTFFIMINSEKCFGEQQFSETPPIYQEITSGEDIKLRCKVLDKRGQCIWQKDRKPVGMHPDKYEWAGNQDSDCSLLIRRASLEFDDGFWECQVTPGDFTRQDALTSLASRLLVRVKPKKPRLEYRETVLSGALTLREDEDVTIFCVSRYGNPPALIKWFIGGDEVEPQSEQTNTTEIDNPKTWSAHSIIRIRGRREMHGLPLRCLTLHPTSPVPAITEIRFDIHYSPEVRVETSPKLLVLALEDSSSFMSIKCTANANPPPTIKWYKDTMVLIDTDRIVQVLQNKTHRDESLVGSEVRFEPVKREDAGLYTCKAENAMGESRPASYRLDVQYGPRLIVNENSLNATVGEIKVIANLNSTVEPFTCTEFEANPPPEYRWIHIRGGNKKIISNTAHHRTAGRSLRFENVVWTDDGEYRCIAHNMINGVRREMPSDVRFVLHVLGPPEIQPRASETTTKGSYESVGRIGDAVHLLKSRFCSRPPPRMVAWQWGSSHIRAGESISPKYEALPLEPITEYKVVTNCYWAKLRIRDLQKEDARSYSLLIESEKGQDSTNILLTVRDPTEIRAIAFTAAAGLLLLVLVAIGIYTIFRIKYGRYRKDEEGSIAADDFYTTPPLCDRHTIPTSSKTCMQKSRQDSDIGDEYDYARTTKKTCSISPEALKVRRAPAVLQPPTIV